MFTSPAWIIAPVVIPLGASLFCFLINRRIFLLPLFAAIANLGAILVLIRQLMAIGPARYSLGNWQAPLGINLQTDGPSLLLLLMTAVTGLGITCYAKGYFSYRIEQSRHPKKHRHQEQFFWPLWMMLLAALNGLFLAADIFNIYVTLELITVSAAALAALSGKSASLIAAFRYLMVSLLGSLSYLLGVVFIYKTYGTLDLVMLTRAIAPEAVTRMGLALITVGLLLKTAVFPLHFWLPPTHANALAPVSALLSSLVVKASFYLLFRFWFDVFSLIVSQSALILIGILGSCAVIWGALQAIRQQRLKLLVAYSTVSQLGYLFIAFPLVSICPGTALWSTVLFMAMAHACAKSSLFMAAGTIFLHAGHDRIADLQGIRASLPVTVFTCAVAGINIMGLPPSGGFIAKWQMLSAALISSQWWWVIVILTGSLLSTVYVFRLVSRLFVIPEGYTAKPSGARSPLLEYPPLLLAILALTLGLLAHYPIDILHTASPFLSNCLPGGSP